MAELKMLRQVMTTTELFSHGEAICDMLRDQYGTYDADSLEEVLVDETFVQRLKAKGYEVFGEGDPRSERGTQRRPLPRLGMAGQNRAREESGARPPTPRNGTGAPIRPTSERPGAGSVRPGGGSTPFRPSSGDGSRPAETGFRSADGAGNRDRQIRTNGVSGRPGERPGAERLGGERNLPPRPAPGVATPVGGIPAAEVPEQRTADAPVAQPASPEVVAPPQSQSETPPDVQGELPAPVSAAPAGAAPTTAAAPVPGAPAVVEQLGLTAETPGAEASVAAEPPSKPAPKTRARTTKATSASPAEQPADETVPAKPRRSTRKRVDPTGE